MKIALYTSSGILRSISLFLILFFAFSYANAQVGSITDDLEKDKPEKFKEKTLKSEKTGDKKFTVPRKFMQNTVTHYNYYFNANNKLNAVIERSRLSNKDNYADLLPFYGYSLNNTSVQKTDLDSVIYKATAGILLHDLRNEWVDNLYLLIGQAYYLRKEFDSASMTFQFINYNLYPRKKSDDDKLVVGTNDNSSAGNSVSIANKEKSDIVTKTLKRPPSRNDALIWQIRTLIETGEYTDAAGLINTLQNDQNFPSRLRPDLEEVNSYWFYKQSMYDSAAFHLEKALSNAADKQDKGRWEYLLAQMYEMNKQIDKASYYYNKAIKNTTDPLLDIYANLNKAKMLKSSDPKEIDRSITNLLKMAKRDKFETYRDIVYYSAGDLALQKPDTSLAVSLFKKSTQYAAENIQFKNKAFFILAKISYQQKDYKAASSYYDSLNLNDTTLGDLAEIQSRKTALSKIVEKINAIAREDSLQQIALMSAADREVFIKKLSKKLRKEQGLKDDDLNNSNNNAGPSSAFNNSKDVANDLFTVNDAKGEWYFYNASMRSKGFTEFRTRWGKRQNVDNWRTINESNTAQKPLIPQPIVDNTNLNDPNANPVTIGSTDLSYEAMLDNIPLTNEKLKISNRIVSTSLFDLGKLYQNSLEDYNMAAATYEKSLQRFPDSLYGGELYLNLYYCYQKTGDVAKASYYKNLLTAKFGDTKYSKYITNPAAILSGNKTPETTKQYEHIYDLFIEGQFDKALQEKKIADSLYGNNYWNPQLLYIESVYYIKQRQDSLAINVLNNIITLYPASPLKSKAATMIDVLKRRGEIEGYLNHLDVTRVKEDSVIVAKNNPVQNRVTQPINNNPLVQNPPVTNPPVNNAVTPPKTNVPAPVIPGAFNIVPEAPHYVLMILNKVDAVYISEARTAFNRYNREKFSGNPIEITKEVIDNDRSILVFKQFADAATALAYNDKIKKDAGAEISWLPANKYSFIIISEPNLLLLKAKKDFEGYLNILKNKFPGKF